MQSANFNEGNIKEFYIQISSREHGTLCQFSPQIAEFLDQKL